LENSPKAYLRAVWGGYRSSPYQPRPYPQDPIYDMIFDRVAVFWPAHNSPLAAISAASGCEGSLTALYFLK